jgi:hypothetical protein
MNIIGLSTARSGSGYGFESLSKIYGYNYLSEFFSEKITNEVINDGKLNFELLDYLVKIKSNYSFPSIDKEKRIKDLETKYNNCVLKILIHQLKGLSFNRLYLNTNNHFILLYRKNNVNRIASYLIAKKHNQWRFDKRNKSYDFTSFYFQNKDKVSIEKFMNSMDILKKYYKKYDWDDVYCYEDFTFDPSVDFKKHIKGKFLDIQNHPIKTPVEYEDVILNFNELKEYVILNYGEYYDIESD